MNRPSMRGLGAISCPSDAPTGASAFTTTARVRMTLVAAVALLLLAMLPGAASASFTNFQLKRVGSNPEFNPFVPGSPALFNSLVASPLGYPSQAGPVIGLGEGACPNGTVFPTGVVTPNTTADQCQAFLRFGPGLGNSVHE